MRAVLDQLIKDRGDTYASISLLLGRNPAYIQQFIKRGTPSALSAADQRAIARHFGVPVEALDCGVQPDERAKHLAAAYVNRAIEVCDSLGLSIAACHLQFGLDVINGSRSADLDCAAV